MEELIFLLLGLMILLFVCLIGYFLVMVIVPPAIVAILSLYLLRSRPIRQWALAQQLQREIVTFWLHGAPLLLGGLWFVGTWVYLASATSVQPVIGFVYSTLSSVALVGFYHNWYYWSAPTAADWALFEGTAQEMGFEQKIALIEWTLERDIANILRKKGPRS